MASLYFIHSDEMDREEGHAFQPMHSFTTLSLKCTKKRNTLVNQ